MLLCVDLVLLCDVKVYVFDFFFVDDVGGEFVNVVCVEVEVELDLVLVE